VFQSAKVKRDSDAQTSGLRQESPKKSRGRRVKQPTPPMSNTGSSVQIQHVPVEDEMQPQFPQAPLQFQFTAGDGDLRMQCFLRIAFTRFVADKLLKAATLYLATHPFLEPVPALTSSQLVRSAVPNEAPEAIHSSSSQFISQPQFESMATTSQDFTSQVSSWHNAASQRFDLQSAFLDSVSSAPFPGACPGLDIAGKYSTSLPSCSDTHRRAEVPVFHGDSVVVGSADCSDIMSDDFETYVQRTACHHFKFTLLLAEIS
jgi:hypothetical protein